jgi:hypothetical protein
MPVDQARLPSIAHVAQRVFCPKKVSTQCTIMDHI